MTAQLKSWARALGGEVSGRGVTCPGPGHSARDRSLSITPSAGAPSGFLVHSFAGDDPIDCLDYVRARLGLPEFSPGRPRKPLGGQSEPVGYMGCAEPKKAAGKLSGDDEPTRKAAAWLWRSVRKPITEVVSSRGQGLSRPDPADARLSPAERQVSARHDRRFGFCDEQEPGLITPPELVTGVHLTRLTMEGDKAPIDPVKKTLGPSVGLPIVLAPANDLLAIDITEGIETGLSVLEWRGTGVWVAGTAGRMPALVENLPPYTECLHIFAERDRGFDHAKEAARIAAARGIETHVKAFGAR
jgi:hypothetical protein